MLSTCLSAGIYIPHLCWLETDAPADAPAACRLCFVEIDGFREPVAACAVTVENGMTVHTGTERSAAFRRPHSNSCSRFTGWNANPARPTAPANCRRLPSFWVSGWDANPSNGYSRSRRWTLATRCWTTTPTGACCAAFVSGSAGSSTSRPG